eukprot:9109748-Ditylum_brightwellii.AAC.1
MKTTDSCSHQSGHSSHREAVSQPRPYWSHGMDCLTYAYSRVYRLLYIHALLEMILTPLGLTSSSNPGGHSSINLHRTAGFKP